MPRIDAICLRAPDPQSLKRFYRDTLGMRERADGTIGYAEEEAGLRFEKSERSYDMSVDDLYWKISISVPNIDLACEQLSGRGVAVDGPRQFGDVAYLAHFKDPAGFAIELLDHWFKGGRPAEDNDQRLLGGGAHLNLLTLRTHDIRQVESICTEIGMTPLSVIPVREHGFTLYFYGVPDEGLPNPDLQAVENRTWVYRRPYTVLEVLHHEQDTEMRRPAAGEAGYHGALLSGLPAGLGSNPLRLYPAGSQ